MPLPERVIQPTSVSRGTLQFNVPDVLEGCTNGTLANIIRQLSSLSRHAEEMFGNLFKEAEAVAGRSSNLQARIDRLAIRVTQLDSTVEEVSLQDIQLRKAFRSSQVFDQQVVSRETMPKALQEAYMACDKPPPLDKLNPYREDGKDGLKFYTDPTYFFELWRQEMLKDTERMMHDRGKKNPTKSGNPNASGQKSADGRHKKRVRQPHSTTERQRQKALGRGEYLMQPGQPGQQLQPELDPHGMNNYHPGQENHNHNFESQPEVAASASMGGGGQQFQERPNSIDVKSAAYYQQLQLQQQQQHQKLNQNSSSINYNNLQNENIYMPRILKNYDDHEQPSPRIYPQTSASSQSQQPPSSSTNLMVGSPPASANSAPLASEEQLSPTRAVGSPSRPSQPPPAPPPEQALSPTRGLRSGSTQRDSLPPPPPPPPTSESDNNLMQLIMQNGHHPAAVTNGGSHHPAVSVGVSGGDPDMLPPPPPNPDNTMLTARVPVEHLPPSPPPFPTSVTSTSTAPPTTSAPPPAAPPPPPPPPPSDQMNGLRITNGDVAKNLKNGKSGSSPTKTDGALIMPKKKPSVHTAQDGVRSDLLKAIRDGIALKKVEQKENEKQEEANGGVSSQTDVASILARRVAVEMSDSDNENASDSEYDSDDWGDESNA